MIERIANFHINYDFFYELLLFLLHRLMIKFEFTFVFLLANIVPSIQNLQYFRIPFIVCHEGEARRVKTYMNAHLLQMLNAKNWKDYFTCFT